MRSFEVLLWLLSSTWAAWWVVRRPNRQVDVGFASASLLIATVHLVKEGARFHMIPVYVLMAGLLALAGRRASSGTDARSGRWARVAVGIPVAVWIAAAAALPTLFPVFAYQTLTGPYGIGTVEYELKDNARSRELVIQAWYPIIRDAKGTPVGITSRPELLAAAYASFTGLPKPLFDNLRLVKTHAFPHAPVARDRERFPVVLFSHGPLSANRS